MQVYGDYTISIERAFSEIDNDWKDYEGIVIGGTHRPNKENTEDLLEIIKNARENGTPLYAECHGHQLVCIEYARNRLGIKDATSEEWGQGTFVVKKLPELNVGLKGGQSYWNNYKVDDEILEKWERPKHFFTAQYHASYQSAIGNFHPLIEEFLNYAKQFKS